MKNNNLYPVSDISIKYQLDWQKKFYNEKIIEFKNNPIGHGKIVFLGNSITQGLRHHIHEFYREDIVNRGISGDYTDGVLARLQEIKYYKPKAVFLLIGLNDFFDDNSDRPERTPQYVAKNIFLISKYSSSSFHFLNQAQNKANISENSYLFSTERLKKKPDAILQSRALTRRDLQDSTNNKCYSK